MVTLTGIAIGFALVFLAGFALFLVLERDSKKAARKTADKSVGMTVGAIGALLMLTAETLAQLADPGILLGGLGILHFAGFLDLDLKLFAIGVVVAFVVSYAMRGRF